MNVSIENQVVWLAPERTGSSITKKILENYNFFSITKKNKYRLVDFRKDGHSRGDDISEEFSNFKIITNIRNPYDRVFACYQKFYLEKPILKKNTNFREKFNKWDKEILSKVADYYKISTREAKECISALTDEKLKTILNVGTSSTNKKRRNKI